MTLEMIGWLDQGLVVLTPFERWQAARLFDTHIMTNPWFILGCVAALLIMVSLLFWVSLRRMREERRNSNTSFIQAAESKRLTVRECQILRAVARRAGLKQAVSVFTSSAAFERGVAALLEDEPVITRDRHRQQMSVEMSVLREKLNTHIAEHRLVDAIQSETLSSRRIPIGQTVLLRPRQGSDVSETEADVVQNGPEALTLRLHGPVTITFGPLWRVCYYIGASVWAFDTVVKSYDGDLLVLKHSDQGRFMNRRRFVRVPVRYPALVARFSFEFIPSRHLSTDKTVAKKTISKGVFGLDHGYVPTFVPAEVTEVAGPGLSIESSLDVKTGDRLLVMFDPDDEATSDQTPMAAHRSPKRMIADVAEVRHTRPSENGLSIAVELSEAKGSEVSELIRLTNTALIRRQEEKKKTTMEMMNVTTSVVETVAV